MIKYNSNTISEWSYGSDNIVKVYRNNAVCYYKVINSGGTPTYQVCYAVVDDISQYTDTEFVDVYDKATEKWYKLNNLNQYEEYGVYGSGRNITYYDGKLTIDDGYEYQYSGGSWINVGEVSGSSRVPNGYTEVEYIENTSRSYLDTGFKPNQDTRIVAEMQCVTSSQYGRYIGAGSYNAINAIQFDYESYYNGTLHISWGANSSWSTYSNCIGDYNRHIYDWDKNYFYRDKGESNQFSASTTYTSFQCTSDLGIFTYINNGSPSSQYSTEYLFGKIYSFQIYDNGTLVRDLVPCKRNSDSLYGAYDIVNDVFYYTPNYSSYPMTGGSATTQVEYPIYYTEKTVPPDNLTFSSMTEANDYAYNNCVYTGERATIDGTRYIFSGDSQGGYEWVEQTSPIPSEYQELQYFTVPKVANNTSNRFEIENELQPNYVYTYEFTPISGFYDGYYGLVTTDDGDTMFKYYGIFKLDNGWGTEFYRNILAFYNYKFSTQRQGNISGAFRYYIGTKATVITKLHNSSDVSQGADLIVKNEGYSTYSGVSTTKVDSSWTPVNGVYNMPLFCTNRNFVAYTPQINFHNFKVEDTQGTTVYDYRPVKRLSDNKVGLFDVVNQQFYYPTFLTLTAGPSV